MIVREPIVHEWEPLMVLEYRFPLSQSELPQQRLARLTPWFARFLGKSSVEISRVEISRLLAVDWKDLDGPAEVLRDALLQYTPTSLLFLESEQTDRFEGDVKLLLSSPNNELAVMTREPFPMSAEEESLYEQFEPQGLKDIRGLPFSICGPYDLDPHGEAFTPYAEQLPHDRLTLRPWTAEEEAKYGSWTTVYHLMSNGSGDLLLMRTDGTIAWWCHEQAWSSHGNEDPGPQISDKTLDVVIANLASYLLGERDDYN